LLEFEPLHPLITFAQHFQLATNWSLDRRASVERWSGHYQRLEEKRKEQRNERSK
jgi:hypothetical protein